MIKLLTFKVNDYDQYGEYFIAWFPTKPTFEQLCELITKNQSGMEFHKYVEHVLNGGGRIGTEFIWYILQKITAGSAIKNEL